MAAAAAMAVVGWWTGYKLGGMIALFAADYFQGQGIENYWQATFLVLCSKAMKTVSFIWYLLLFSSP